MKVVVRTLLMLQRSHTSVILADRHFLTKEFYKGTVYDSTFATT